jgi:uncharacterized alkaline shock family protein YloU
MEGHSSISPDVLARYAADAATDSPGVRGLVESPLHRHRGVRVVGDVVELHLAIDWGVSAIALAEDVQRRVAAYLLRMADMRPAAVNVCVDAIGDAAA